MATPSNQSGDIDRKALRVLMARVGGMHAAHRQRLRDSLPGDQRPFFDALPVLFHSNHAALPGFVDFETPAGIDGYSPDPEVVAATRKLALSYNFERFKVRTTAIQSLIVEPNDAGAMHVWVVAARSHHEGLAPKLTAIERHARLLKMDFGVTALDALDVRAGREAALGATPKLALDRIYRRGIVLAGRLPIWWLVPPGPAIPYPEYCERLRSQRFIRASDTVDLGGASRVPARECVAAGIEALDAALDDPYRWLPQLALIESYLDGFGSTLADRLKARVQSPNGVEALGVKALGVEALGDEALGPGAEDHDFLTQVDTHLAAAGDPNRLDVVRVAMLEAGVPGAQERATGAWGFAEERLRELGNRDGWRFATWVTEDRRVEQALRASFAKLRAHAPHGEEGAPITALAVRFDRAYPARPAHANAINPALLPRRWAPPFTLERMEVGWRLHDQGDEIVGGDRLIHVALWAHIHRLDPRHLTIVGSDLPSREVSHRFRRLGEILSKVPSDFTGALLVLNAEENPAGAKLDAATTLLSDYDDALDFSGFRANLVEAVDYVNYGGGAPSHTVYRAGPGLAEAVARAVGDPNAGYRCACVQGTHAQAPARAMESRVADLIAQGQAALARGTSFVHALGAGLVLYRRIRGIVVPQVFADPTEFASNFGADFESISFDTRSERLLAHLRSLVPPPSAEPHRPSA